MYTGDSQSAQSASFLEPYKAPSRSLKASEAVCIFFTVIIALVGLLFLLWWIWLVMAVGIYARVNHIQCDKPLANWLIVVGVLLIVLIILNAVAGKCARRGMAIWGGFLALSATAIITIIGHVFVWKSVTCQATSMGLIVKPTKLMFSLYDTSRGTVIALTVLLVLWLLFLIISVTCVSSFERFVTWSRNGGSSNDSHETYTLVADSVTRAVVPGLARHMNEKMKKSDRPDSGDYQPVATS